MSDYGSYATYRNRIIASCNSDTGFVFSRHIDEEPAAAALTRLVRETVVHVRQPEESSLPLRVRQA